VRQIGNHQHRRIEIGLDPPQSIFDLTDPISHLTHLGDTAVSLSLVFELADLLRDPVALGPERLHLRELRTPPGVERQDAIYLARIRAEAAQRLLDLLWPLANARDVKHGPSPRLLSSLRRPDE
jgi:hypothetical protein